MNPLGIRLQVTPAQLVEERVLMYFDGPLISLYRNGSDEPYIEMWADQGDDGSERWILFRTTELDLTRYVAGKVPLRDLVSAAPDGYVIVRDVNGNGVPSVSLVPISDIPEEIMPREGALHDRKFEPTAEDGHPVDQAILLTGSWDMPGLSELQRRYAQVYSLSSLISKRSDGSARPANVHNYRFRGGYIYKTIYDKFEHMVMGAKRPKFTAVHYASPGYLRMQVDPEYAALVRDVVQTFIDNFEDIRALYDELHPKLLDFGKWIEATSGDPDPAELKRFERGFAQPVSELADALNISLQALKDVAVDDSAAGYILASYYRRLKDLAFMQMDNRADML